MIDFNAVQPVPRNYVACPGSASADAVLTGAAIDQDSCAIAQSGGAVHVSADVVSLCVVSGCARARDVDTIREISRDDIAGNVSRPADQVVRSGEGSAVDRDAIV